MQKKTLIKTTREYLQNIFPENLLPIKKINKKQEKLLIYKTRGLKRKIKKAEQQIFKQYFKHTQILQTKKIVYNSRFANYTPFLYSMDQIKSELIKKQIKTSDFKSQLKERKKLSILYGNLSKKQIQKISYQAHQFGGKIYDNLLLILESRLDILLFKACFFPSIYSARQWIRHNKILVNSKCIDISSYQVQPGDIISIKPQYRINFYTQILDFLKKNFYSRRSRYIISSGLLKKLKRNTRLNGYTFKKFYFTSSKQTDNKVEFVNASPAYNIFSQQSKKNLLQVKKIINSELQKSYSYKFNKQNLAAKQQNKTLLRNALNSLNNSKTNHFLIYLKLEKLFRKNRARRHTFSVLQRSILKPVNLEISYKNLSLIYLYSPQKLGFPCTLDLELIVRSLR